MSRTLLFVDDDLDVREAFGDLFDFAGWTVAYAADGAEALEWLEQHGAPAAIVLDLKMPRLDGYEFRRRQLADARWRAVPTVVFTADANVDGVSAPMLEGAPVVRKSAPFTELAAVLERVAAVTPVER
jgi:CheY-like chemotaxis protein